MSFEVSFQPIRHQLEHRADAHILIAFLAYCLQVTLKNRLMIHAPGLTPSAVMDTLATIQMIDHPDRRRTLVDSPPLHATGKRCPARPRQTQARPARATSSAHHRRSRRQARFPGRQVVAICGEDLLITLTDS